MKNREEVEQLKQEWYSDPMWDIEDTEGFEEYKTELTQYRMFCEFNWEQNRNEKLQAKSVFLGIPGNIALTHYILSLENRIVELENKLDKHLNEE